MHCSPESAIGDIVHLNVGGKRFSTSKPTLTWVPDSFFSSMLSGRISTLQDETGAIFIDRDPNLFEQILKYLRTKEVDLTDVNIPALRHEAEFYSITPLIRRLLLCEQLDDCSCGGILFHGYIPPAVPPARPRVVTSVTSAEEQRSSNQNRIPSTSVSEADAISLPGSQVVSVPGSPASHVRDSQSLQSAHSNHSLYSVKYYTQHPTLVNKQTHKWQEAVCEPLRVNMITGHFNWIAAAYSHFVCLYRMKESSGWKLAWTSPYIEQRVDHIALNTNKVPVSLPPPAVDNAQRMIAAAHGTHIQLWSVSDNGDNVREIGVFQLSVPAEHLFFIGSQLVSLSSVGKVGVWHAMTQNWQVQDVTAISSYDTAGSFLLLGCQNGSIYYIDMEKFPLRMKDNDLLVTELYHDPACDAVTALSVYLTPKLSNSGNWIEIAYGTREGRVRVIVQHPETVGQGPQMFQTFTVHRSPICKIMLSEKFLISVCSEYNHVRSWSVTRFRGMISTQPGSMSLASFKVVSLEDYDPQTHYAAGNDVGPHGEKDEQQLFIQKVVPETDKLFIRLASTGKRVCVIQAVDGQAVSSFCVHECEASNRIGARSRKFLFTGHTNGAIQIWDLSTALEMSAKGHEDPPEIFGPNPQEIMQQLEACELSNSCANTPNMSPATSLLATNTLYSSGMGSKHGSMERGRVRSLSTQSASGSTRKDSHV